MDLCFEQQSSRTAGTRYGCQQPAAGSVLSSCYALQQISDSSAVGADCMLGQWPVQNHHSSRFMCWQRSLVTLLLVTHRAGLHVVWQLHTWSAKPGRIWERSTMCCLPVCLNCRMAALPCTWQQQGAMQTSSKPFCGAGQSPGPQTG
jgi:hypothetical protein